MKIINDEIEKLKQENEDLKDKLTDLLFEQNYSIEKELAEFVRSLYDGVLNIDKNLSKEDIIKNIKVSIEDFSKNYKFKL